MNANQYMAAGIAAFLIGLGVCIGYLIWGQQDGVTVEPYAPPISMADGSLVLSREPDGKPTLPEPTHPKGTKVGRTIEATVSGGAPVRKTPEIEHDGGNVLSDSAVKECLTTTDFVCPPVTVRIDELTYPDKSRRFQIVTDKGEVLDGVDIPREPMSTVNRRNSLTVASDGGRNGAGLYTRKVWRGLSLGGGVIVYEGNAVPVGSVRLDW